MSEIHDTIMQTVCSPGFETAVRNLSDEDANKLGIYLVNVVQGEVATPQQAPQTKEEAQAQYMAAMQQRAQANHEQTRQIFAQAAEKRKMLDGLVQQLVQNMVKPQPPPPGDQIGNFTFDTSDK